MPDKIIDLKNPKNPKSDVEIYEDTSGEESFIYNYINYALQFQDSAKHIIKFYLARTKINFKINGSKNIAGELIDISIPHRKDSQMSKYTTSKKFKKNLDKHIIKNHDADRDFDYYSINIEYIIKDLMNILYTQNVFPWDDTKYLKRIARLIYFIFANHLDRYRMYVRNLRNLQKQYMYFIESIQTLENVPELKNKYLKMIIANNITLVSKTKTDKQINEFAEYILALVKFSKAIIRICDNLTLYMTGKTTISTNYLYGLDIV